jgi:Rnl2 family RNA ligase
MPISLLQFPKISPSGLVGASPDDWVASEKIHGAQLVIAADPSEIRVGKRKAWLEADEAFFGWQILRPILYDAGRAIQRAVDPRGSVWIYGELFGGSYPHASASPVAGLVAVQTGVWYAPDLRYAVFDIIHEAPGAPPHFLADDRVRQLARDAGLLSPPLLGRGRFSELDRLPVRFPSKVPEQLGLSAISGNYAEGYVLKHAGRSLLSERPIVKRKIAEFDELRFDESRAFDPTVHLAREELMALVAQLVNPPRLASARSKVGADPERIVEEAVLDALIDLRDMLPRRIEAMPRRRGARADGTSGIRGAPFARW